MVIGSEGGREEGEKYLYGRSWYTSYGGTANPQEDIHGRSVLQLHPQLDLLDFWRIQRGMRIMQRRLEVHLICMLAELPQQDGVASDPGIDKGDLEPIHRFRQDTQSDA